VGIPTDIFTLHELRGEGADCRHHLLLRVGRPGFNNADEGDSARADGVADEKRNALLEAFESEILDNECGARHAVTLSGELQARPVGDELSDGRGRVYVELWVAETRFGRPWVVLGAAAGEEEFWRGVEADEELSALRPSRPASKLRAYFLAEGEVSDGDQG
jgi:hypothetical protein